jgi:Ca2+-binding RTX toxin-like protein
VKLTDGSDTLDNTESASGSTNDEIYGGAGIDTISSGNAADKIYGQAGNDILNGGSQNDLIFGGSGDDLIDGGEGSDEIYGGSGNDQINGGSNGTDILIGGYGQDVLTGGNGNDIFKYLSTLDSGDTIADFTPNGDIIDLTAIDANTSVGTPGDQAFAFVDNPTPATSPGVIANSITWYQSDGNTYIQADVTGDTTADLVIELTGTKTITADAFDL